MENVRRDFSTTMVIGRTGDAIESTRIRTESRRRPLVTDFKILTRGIGRTKSQWFLGAGHVKRLESPTVPDALQGFHPCTRTKIKGTST